MLASPLQGGRGLVGAQWVQVNGVTCHDQSPLRLTPVSGTEASLVPCCLHTAQHPREWVLAVSGAPRAGRLAGHLQGLPSGQVGSLVSCDNRACSRSLCTVTTPALERLREQWTPSLSPPWRTRELSHQHPQRLQRDPVGWRLAPSLSRCWRASPALQSPLSSGAPHTMLPCLSTPHPCCPASSSSAQ